MKIHKLKTVQPYFDYVHIGVKIAELRKNDRDYKPHDILILQEYNPYFEDSPFKPYSGREVVVIITSIVYEHESLNKGYVLLSFKHILNR